MRIQNYHKANKMLNPLASAAADVVNGEFVSWKTSVIMKDNSLRDDYSFAEFVSAMGGPDVEILQPEFAVLPAKMWTPISSVESLSAGVKRPMSS